MSRTACQLWMERLVAAVPDLKSLHDEHLVDYDELMPHLFLAEIARYVTREFAAGEYGSLRRDSREAAVAVLRFLERAVIEGGPELLELVSVSFLENIDWESTAGQILRSALGPALLSELSRRESS